MLYMMVGSPHFNSPLLNLPVFLFCCAFPVSSEIPDLYDISDLLEFLSCFTSQNKEIKGGNYFFDVCCVN